METFVCTRRGDLGRVSHKAFGLFFLLSMQNAVLRRPGNENSRIPHFLYIDEFPDFICKDTEAIFTLYRKYKVATTITAQNLSQLEANAPDMKYRETIISNCANKIFLGNADNTEPEKRLTARIEAVSIFVILLIISPRFVYKTLLFYVKISSFIMQEIISFCNIPIRDSMCEKI